MKGGQQEQDEARGSFPFPRSARLLQHAAFDRVYREGRRIFARNLTAFVRCRGEDETLAGPRVGFTVSRALGGAVERNRMKRRLRAAVRRYLALLDGPVDVVINPKKTLLSAEFASLLLEIEQAFNRIRQNDSRTAGRVPPVVARGRVPR